MRRISTVVAAVLTTALFSMCAPTGALAAGADPVAGNAVTTWAYCATDQTVTATLNATSDPSGQNPTGSFQFVCSNGDTFAGTVQCLNVSGNIATIGGTVTSSTSPAIPVGQQLTFTVIDDNPDGISSLSSGINCTIRDNGFNAVTAGDIVVIDTTPTPSPACSDGIDNDNDGKIDYPADAGCTSATDNDETDPPPPPPAAPTSKQQCMNNGWKNYPTLNFRNQGDCTNYVNKHSK